MIRLFVVVMMIVVILLNGPFVSVGGIAIKVESIVPKGPSDPRFVVWHSHHSMS